jgi:methylated-DNA-[protein]-cysteine S-methyltransferase
LRLFNYNYFESPLGKIEVRSDSEGVYAIKFVSENDLLKPNSENVTPHVEEAIKQIKEYFNGERKIFDIKLRFRGTDFQNSVWNQLQQIPFGKTYTYLKMARLLGDEKCIRAAASANGKNPFAIVIPCHRVIGTNGSLTGYAGELWRKQWLLEHEARVCGTLQTLF